VASDSQSTKDRLLDAAERLFAQHGFDGVSIRDLSSEADVNVAAVNYHFQSKENLYDATLIRRIKPIKARVLQAIAQVTTDSENRPDLEELIRAFVHTYLEDALSEPDGDTVLQLMVREIHTPHRAGGPLFKELVVPVHRVFLEALSRARPDLDSQRLLWIIASIIGQVIHFMIRWRRSSLPQGEGSEETPRDLFPPLVSSLDSYIHQVVDHVTCFSLGGIEACARDH